jgi:phospholipid/cholesterol/gamma-HCH transport system ATP-binding protein
MDSNTSNELGPRVAPPLVDTPIRFEHVSLSFGDFTALSDLSFCVRRGDIAVIIGGSGAGKTTVGRIIVGLLPPTRGAVYVDGQNIAPLDRRERRRACAQCGMVFQYSALLDSLTVLENVGLPLREHERMRGPALVERVEEMLNVLDLEGVSELYPSELSGGMRKRVALARALIRRPSILVYDEPTSGLDPLTARLVDDLIRRTRDRFGLTSVVISHDMAQAFSLADRLYVMDAGRLLAQGTPHELRADATSLAARFYAASQGRAPAFSASAPHQ